MDITNSQKYCYLNFNIELIFNIVYEIFSINKIEKTDIFSMKIPITFSKFFITKSKFEENAILKPLDVHVLLHLWHFPTNSQIVQILYIKRTYILCNNIQ